MKTLARPAGLRRSVRRSRALYSLVLAAGAAASIGSADAAIIDWNNAAGGSTGVAGNWSPVGLPAAADDQRYDLASAYTVTHAVGVPTSRTHQYLAGNVTVVASAAHTATDGVTIANLLGDVATMRLTTGTLTSGGGVVVANASGATGTLTVDDDDADLLVTGTGADLQVGVGGDGTLNITGGGRVVVADQFIAGANASSVADVLVSGFVVAPIAASVLDVQGTSQSRIGAGGDVAMLVEDGAAANFGGSLVVANGSASTSSITVQEAGLLDARLNVAGDLLIARNTSAGAAAGNGSVAVHDGGSVTVEGTTFLGGDPDGGTASLTISGGEFITRSLTVADFGATLAHVGGRVDVTGGVLDPQGTTLTVNSTTGVPVLHLLGGATCSLSSAGTALNIGPTGRGTVGLYSPDTVLSVTGSTVLGAQSSGHGELTLDSGAHVALDPSRTCTVGSFGRGDVSMNGTTTLESGPVMLGSGATGDGNVDLWAASLWTVTGSAAIGGTFGAAGGSGDLLVAHQAEFHATDDLTVWENGGTLTINGDGLVRADGVVTVNGVLELDGGTLQGAQVLLNTGPVSMNGAVRGSVTIPVGTSVTANGELSMGTNFGVIAFRNLGTLNVGGHAVNIECAVAPSADIGNTTIAGGTLSAPSSGELQIDAGKTLSGNGIVNANMDNDGTITPTGTGLAFNGIVTGVGQGFAGTRAVFGAGGGFVGAGAIECAIESDIASRITATGALTLGSPSDIRHRGELICGPHTVTISDSDGGTIGVRTSLDGGNLVSLNGLNTLAAAGTVIEGHGVILAPTFSCSGRLAPGLGATSQGVGLLGVAGAMVISFGAGNGGLEIDLAGNGTPGSCDRVTVTGACTLGGDLTVNKLDSFHPLQPMSITVLSASSISGTFATTTLPPGYAVQYTPTTVRIKVCPGDFNSQNGVTVQDIYDFLAEWNSQVNDGPVLIADADFNGDRRITVQDIYDFLAAWNMGCP